MTGHGNAVNQYASSGGTASQPQEFDESMGILRFTVRLGHGHVIAYLTQATWQARFGAATSGSNLLDLYLQHRPMIDAVVASMSAAGARHPIVLRANEI
jgi:hypothetical protein